MKNTKLLKTTIVTVVALGHLSVGWLLWSASQTTKQPKPVEIDNLTFVDLGSLEGNNQASVDGAPALPAADPPPMPTPPAKKPKPQPVKKIEPKPKVNPVKPQVKAVIRHDKPADLIQPPKQPEKPSIKPIKKQPEKAIEVPKKTNQAITKDVEKQPKKVVEQPVTKLNKPTIDKTKTDFTPLNQSMESKEKSGSNIASKGGTNTSPNGTNNGGGGSNPNSNKPSNGVGSSNGSSSGKGLKSNDKNSVPASKGGTGIADGGYIKKPAPPYPAAAREREEEGTVKIEVIVDAQGNVMSAQVVASSGSSRLDRAAKDAARRAQYRPKKIDGQSVKTRFVAGYTFVLD